MRVKRIVMLTAMVALGIMMLSGCSKKTPKSIAEKALKEDVSVLENYEFDIVGRYEEINYYEKGEQKEVHDYEKEFEARATDIQINEITDDTISVTATIANKYYKLVKEHSVTYHYNVSDDNVITITYAEIGEEGDNEVEPTVKFDKKQFWEEEYLVFSVPDYFEVQGCKFPTTRDETIEMSEVTDIEFDPQCKNAPGTPMGRISSFTQNGEYIFTTKDGKKYNGIVHVEYMPNCNNKELKYSNEKIEPHWSISSPYGMNSGIDVDELQ